MAQRYLHVKEISRFLAPFAYSGYYYLDTEDCLYFVDSENHAIRKADMGAQLVETLYPTSTSNKRSFSIWTRIMGKLGFKSSGESNAEERSEVFDSKSLYFPWHLLKSVDDTLFIIDRRFQTLWTMDLGSGKIDETFKGSPGIFEICGQQIMKNLSILDQIPCDWFQQKTNNSLSLEGLPHYDLLSSLTTLQNHIFICDTVEMDFQVHRLIICNISSCFQERLTLSVDVPMDIELVEPLQEACIWCQTRGAATEIFGMDDVPGSLDKVGVVQQWYDELDDLASPKPESEMVVEHDNLDKNLVVEDQKVRISCCVCTSPGTSYHLCSTVFKA